MQDKLTEIDLLKFQLVSSYMGMAKQAMEALKTEEDLLLLKQQNASKRLADCQAQMQDLNRQLVEVYAIGPKDTLNFVTGEIRREASQEAQETQPGPNPILVPGEQT